MSKCEKVYVRKKYMYHLADDVMVLSKTSKTSKTCKMQCTEKEHFMLFTQTLLEAVQTAEKTANFIFSENVDKS